MPSGAQTKHTPHTQEKLQQLWGEMQGKITKKECTQTQAQPDDSRDDNHNNEN